MILPRKAAWAFLGALGISACSEPLDFDLRGQVGAFSTTNAARNATADRPTPDARGVLSYPSYQVAVARRGDTIESVASRVGLPADQMATFNGIPPGTPLRDGEIIALPRRVAEPTISGAPGSGVDVATLAGRAIDNAPDTTPRSGPTTTPLAPADGATGSEPIRHRVARGETAFSIARLYKVPVKALAEWNGLGSDFAVREGQYLLIPVTLPAPANETAAAPDAESDTVTPPGQGSATPVPPSASQPLPEDETAEPVAAPPKPDIGQTTTASKSKMTRPVEGTIIREYAKGRNEGIDIKGEPGATVVAAADGTVAAITKSAEGIPIIVVRHPDNLLTVYANVGEVDVRKGDRVKRGNGIAKLRKDNKSFVHFEVRQGFDSVDPNAFLQ